MQPETLTMLYNVRDPVQFFAFNTKLPEMAMLPSEDFTAAEISFFQWARPDEHWIKSLMLIHLS